MLCKSFEEAKPSRKARCGIIAFVHTFEVTRYQSPYSCSHAMGGGLWKVIPGYSAVQQPVQYSMNSNMTSQANYQTNVYTPIHCTPIHCTPIHCTPIHYTPIHCTITLSPVLLIAIQSYNRHCARDTCQVSSIQTCQVSSIQTCQISSVLDARI